MYKRQTLNYLTENNLLQYADLEKKAEDIHSSYARTGSELKNVEAKLREVQPLIKNISNYQRLKPVYDAYMKAADKPAYRAKHEAEDVYKRQELPENAMVTPAPHRLLAGRQRVRQET